MSLHGSTTKIKIIYDPTGTAEDMTATVIFDSFNPNVSTNALTRTGIGGITKSRVQSHDYQCDLGGDITKYDFLNYALQQNAIFELQAHDQAIKNAVIESLNISCSQEDTLKFSATMKGKKIEEIGTTAVTDETPTGTIDGSNKQFTLANTPVKRNTVSIVPDGGTAITDDGAGNLSDGGTIDYSTGIFTLASAPTTSLLVDYTWLTTVSSMGDPGTFFVMADSVITFSGSPALVSEFEINCERDVTGQYGSNYDPQQFSVGAFKHSGTITLLPSASLADLGLGARLPSDPSFDFTAVFKDDPDSPTKIIKLSASGMIGTESSADISPDSPIEIPVNFDAESFSVSNTE